MKNLADSLMRAAKKAEETKKEEITKAAEVEIIDATKSLFKDSRDVTLAGALPGITLTKMIQAFGEPVSREDIYVTFGNGLRVVLDDTKNIAKKIIVRTPDIVTPEDVAVGMADMVLNTAYGTADKTDINREEGKVDYRYFSKDNKKIATFTTIDGVITKIENELKA